MRAGLVARLDGGPQVVAALRELKRRGYTHLDALTPYPVEGVGEALELRRSRLGWVVFAIALLGTATAYLIQWYTAVRDYPLDSGGRPANALPAFVPICFETTVLFASLAALLGVLFACHLPQLWHPLFEVPGFERVTSDRFFVLVDARDPVFDPVRTAADLAAAGSDEIRPVGEVAK